MRSTAKPTDPRRTSGGRKPSAFIITGGTLHFAGIAPPTFNGVPIPPHVPSQVGYGFWHKLAEYSRITTQWLDALGEANSRNVLLARLNVKNGNGRPPIISAALNLQMNLVRWMVSFFGNDINCLRIRCTNLLNACIESQMPMELCREVRDQYPELENSLCGGTFNPHETACVTFARANRLIPDDFLHRRSRQFDRQFLPSFLMQDYWLTFATDLIVYSAISAMDHSNICPANVWRILSTALPGQIKKVSQAGIRRCIEIGTGYRFPEQSSQRTLIWARTFTVCRLFRRNLVDFTVKSQNAPHLIDFARKNILLQVAISLMDNVVVHYTKVEDMLQREARVMPNLCLMSKNSISQSILRVEHYAKVEPQHLSFAERTIKVFKGLIKIIDQPIYTKRDLIGIRNVIACAIISYRRRRRGMVNEDGLVFKMENLPQICSEVWLLIFEKLATYRSMLYRN